MYEPLAAQSSLQSPNGSEAAPAPEGVRGSEGIPSEQSAPGAEECDKGSAGGTEQGSTRSADITEQLPLIALAASYGHADADAEQEWITRTRQERSLNEPGASGIGLQACRLEVHGHEAIMGHNPAVFEADKPWWHH